MQVPSIPRNAVSARSLWREARLDSLRRVHEIGPRRERADRGIKGTGDDPVPIRAGDLEHLQQERLLPRARR